jgi:hypothetical protein
MSELGADEQMRRRVLAGGDARAAADARGGVHRLLGHVFGNQDRVAVLRAADVDGAVAARGDDAIESAPIDDEILHDGEGLRPPRLDGDGVAVLEPAHVELTDRGAAIGSVRHAVDDEAAHPANAFATVGVERDGVLALFRQPFVDDVEHFEKRHVGRHVLRGVIDQASGGGGTALPPDSQIQSHIDPRQGLGRRDWGLAYQP